MEMKTRAYILLLMMTALAFWSCEDDTQYVSQEKLAIKVFPIKALTDPCLLPDGSIVTLTVDDQADFSPTTPGSLSYHLVKLSTDGIITQSPDIKYNIENNRPEANIGQLNFANYDIDDIDITSSGEVYFKYLSRNGRFLVSTFETGAYIDTMTSKFVSGKFHGGVPLNDGTYAVVHGNDPVLTIFDSNGEWQKDLSLPYIHYNNDDTCQVFGICGNIMIMNTDESKTEHEFYVFSPSGENLNYGTSNFIYERIVNITDPATQTHTHSYAINSGSLTLSDDEESSSSETTGCILTKLDNKGCILYQKEFPFVDICNVIEHDGKLIMSGYYAPQSYETFSINEYMRTATTIKGKIAIVDAETGDGDDSDTHTISFEGGVMPFAAVPDSNGEYDIFMARIFSDDAGQMGDNNQFTESIYLYHIDDLNKLQIE